MRRGPLGASGAGEIVRPRRQGPTLLCGLSTSPLDGPLGMRPLALTLITALVGPLTACVAPIRDLSTGPVAVRTEPADRYRPERLVIAVTLKTRRNLYSIPENYLLRAETYFCDRPKDYVILGLGTIYVPTAEPETPLKSLGESGASNSPDSFGVYTYVVLLDVSRRASPKSQPPEIGFDLAASPRSICVRLKGGGYLEPSVSSNTVKVSDSDIREAFEHVSKAGG